MTDVIAFALAVELVTLFFWWLKGGWGDVTELIGIVRRVTRGDK